MSPEAAVHLAIQIPYDDAHLELAARLGLRRIQLRVGPGFPIDTGDPQLREARAAAADLARRGLRVVALGCYRNLLSADAGERRREIARLRRVMAMAPLFGTGVVGVFAGRDPDRSLADNLPAFADVWAPLAEEAEAGGLRLAFENCTMLRGDPPRGINLSFTPWAYERMFELLPSPALGIELDPSHLHKQCLDPVAFVRRFAPRIVHVHAKDHEHLPEQLALHGRFSLLTSRDRLPGRGEIDFRAFFAALRAAGYDGAVTLEPERDVDATGARRRLRLLREAVAHLRRAMAASPPPPPAARGRDRGRGCLRRRRGSDPGGRRRDPGRGR
ncbi:MAG: sugar phosphate isomerase/epimerase [Acidobacteria bacterium]|nr:MAG: sugar phosphate isomerase/epimerase [Acidobacteriota bacterium]